MVATITIDSLVEGIAKDYVEEIAHITEEEIQLLEEKNPILIYGHDNTKKLTDLLLEGYESHFNEDQRKLIQFGVAYSVWNHMIYKRKNNYSTWFNHPFSVARSILEEYKGVADPILILESLIHDIGDERITNDIKRRYKSKDVYSRADIGGLDNKTQLSLKRRVNYMHKRYLKDLEKSLKAFIETDIEGKERYLKEMDRIYWVGNFVTKPFHRDYFSYIQSIFGGQGRIQEDRRINDSYSPKDALGLWKKVMEDTLQIKFPDRRNNSDHISTFGIDEKLVNFYKNLILIVNAKRYVSGPGVVGTSLRKNEHIDNIYHRLLETTIEGLKKLESEIYEDGKYVFKGAFESFKELPSDILRRAKETLTDNPYGRKAAAKAYTKITWEEIRHRWLHRKNQMFRLKDIFYDWALAAYDMLGGMNAITEKGETKIDRQKNKRLYWILEAPEKIPVLKYLWPCHYVKVPLDHSDGTMARWAARIYKLKEDTSSHWPLKQYYKDTKLFLRIANELRDNDAYSPDFSFITKKDALRASVTTI